MRCAYCQAEGHTHVHCPQRDRDEADRYYKYRDARGDFDDHGQFDAREGG